MKCGLCNNEVVKIKGPVEFEVRSLGKISVPNLKYFECTACGDKLLTTEQSDKAFEFIAKEEQNLTNLLPIGEFISAIEAAAFLGITKQAFSKHPKIRGGFIYSAKIGARKYYHQKSVELFKERGNGKFLLVKQEEKFPITQIDEYIGAEADFIYEEKFEIESTTILECLGVSYLAKAYSFTDKQTKFTTDATDSTLYQSEVKFNPYPSVMIGDDKQWLLATKTEKL